MVGVAGRFFQLGEFKDGAVKLRDLVQFQNAQGKMTNSPRHLLIVLRVEVGTIFHALLRQIKDITGRIVSADTGKRAIAGALQNADFRIFFFEPREDEVDVLNFKAEMIKAGLSAWSPGIEIESNISVAHHNSASSTGHSGSL